MSALCAVATGVVPGGELNIAHNVLDRHATVDDGSRNHAAIIWEGGPGETRTLTFHELHRQTNRVANYLDSVGVGVGDTVGLYMPMVPEVASILYGCFKIGAIAVSGTGVTINIRSRYNRNKYRTSAIAPVFKHDQSKIKDSPEYSSPPVTIWIDRIADRAGTGPGAVSPCDQSVFFPAIPERLWTSGSPRRTADLDDSR